jgi:hypothetical protein
LVAVRGLFCEALQVESLSDEAIRTLAERYAEVVDALAIPAGDPLLVLPNGEFFPDKFTGDAQSVERLAARIQGYAGLEDLAVDARLSGEAALDAAGCGTGGCGSGACATPATGASTGEPRLERIGTGYVVRVPAAELGHPIVLTARLATAFGAIALLERHPEGATLIADPAEPELAAVALGFGVLLLEASYLYKKSCGGPSVSSATALGCDELAVLFALSAAREKHPLREALGELAATQRAAVKDAALVVDECPGLVKLLREEPGRAAQGQFKLRDGRSLWSRMFGRSKPKSEADRIEDALAALERGASVDELHRLVGPADGE